MTDEPKNFGAFLDRTYKVVRQDLFRRFKAAGLNITPEQWIILAELAEADGQSQVALANNSFKDAPTVSRILELLVKKELIRRERAPGDRRHYRVFLTPKGRETIAQAMPAVWDSRRKGWQQLNEEDYHTFIRILTQVFQNYTEQEQEED